MLVVDDVAFAYPAGPSFHFSLTAAPGEVTAIAGRSGSGKSTLFDLVAGFQRPGSGRILLDGNDITAIAPQHRPVAVLFQTDNVFDHLTAAENLRLARRTPIPAAEIDTALAEVDLAGLARRPVASLSGGQKQRVGLARTLLLNRPVLLLDEPFSALDDETRVALRSLVQRLTRERKWVTLLVTHHDDDIAAIADRRYMLSAGRLVAG